MDLLQRACWQDVALLELLAGAAAEYRAHQSDGRAAACRASAQPTARRAHAWACLACFNHAELVPSLASREALTYRQHVGLQHARARMLAGGTRNALAVQSLQETPGTSRGTIEGIYGMIVTQAREPLFYRDLGVPDTVNGRFDLLVLHLWMVLRRLKTMRGARNFPRRCSMVSVTIWTRTCAKWASAISPSRSECRPLGGLLRPGSGLRSALTAGEEPLAQALCKNILNDGNRKKLGSSRSMLGRPLRR